MPALCGSQRPVCTGLQVDNQLDIDKLYPATKTLPKLFWRPLKEEEIQAKDKAAKAKEVAATAAKGSEGSSAKAGPGSHDPVPAKEKGSRSEHRK